MTDSRTFSRKQLFTILKWTLCAAVVVWVGVVLLRQIKSIDWTNVHFHPLFVIGAAVAIALVTVTQFVAYRLLLSAYGPVPSWPATATLSWLPALGKYVPGKVVAISGTVYLLRKFKIPAAVALSVALLGDALAVLTGLIVGAPMLSWPAVREKLPGSWIAASVLIIGGTVCLYPSVFAKLVNFALRKMKRQPITVAVDLRHYVLPLVAAFSQWLFWGIALWFTARAITSVPVSTLGVCIFMIAMANTIGYLVVFSPGGLGAREAVLYAGLRTIIDPKWSAVIVIALRLIQTVVEILLAGLAVWILRNLREESPAVEVEAA
jgi:uncharacterized membrane protein YbhN (UPF0104 family)